jgi:hypothetical protein
VVGTGGGNVGVPLDDFGPAVEGSVFRASQYGYCRATGTTESLLVEFVGLDGSVVDSVEITGDPPVSST